MIGGSVALASRTGFGRIVALDPDAVHAEQALSAGIIDERVAEVPADTDAVLIACPSDGIADWVVQLADHAATVIDAGSVKGAILEQVEAQLGRIPANFVPAHPIAGLERSGPSAADAGLFQDKLVIVCPTPSTSAQHLEQASAFWQATGARLQEMDPREHDRIYARTSHLPHLLAFAYLLGVDEADLAHTGGGFRDFSRIGGSDPDMWSAVFELNRSALLEALNGFERDLAAFREALESGDLARCRTLIARARARRELL